MTVWSSRAISLDMCAACLLLLVLVRKDASVCMYAFIWILTLILMPMTVLLDRESLRAVHCKESAIRCKATPVIPAM